MIMCPTCGSPRSGAETACTQCGTVSEGAFFPSDSTDDEERTEALASGTVLGSYRLLEIIGEGGIGHVYLAEHVRLGRRVALKKLRSDFTTNRRMLRRFFDEARAANQIAHDNIVDVTDFIEHETDGAYLIMELLRGMDLRKLLREQPIPPIERSLGILLQVAAALRAAHEAGIVHRDLKPDNIFLTQRGGQQDFVKLLDFGVAKLTQDSPTLDGSANKTSAGTILGTPAYMSPEQACGRPLDHRTDVYAFGVITYEILAGRLPLTGKSFGEYVVQHTTVVPEPPSATLGLPHRIPEELERLTLRCLEKSADMRPSTMQEIEEVITRVAERKAWSLMSFAPPRPVRRKTPWRVGAAATVGVVLITGAAGVSLMHERAKRAAPPHASQPNTKGEKAPAMPTAIVSFASSPEGAQVRDARSGKLLGVTPFNAEVAASNEPMPVLFELSGFRPERRAAMFATGARISITMQPLAEPETTSSPRVMKRKASGHAQQAPATARSKNKRLKRPRPKASNSDRGAVLDPF